MSETAPSMTPNVPEEKAPEVGEYSKEHLPKFDDIDIIQNELMTLKQDLKDGKKDPSIEAAQAEVDAIDFKTPQDEIAARKARLAKANRDVYERANAEALANGDEPKSFDEAIATSGVNMNKLHALEELWKENGGEAIEAAQAEVDAIDFKTPQDEIAARKARLATANRSFFESITEKAKAETAVDELEGEESEDFEVGGIPEPKPDEKEGDSKEPDVAPLEVPKSDDDEFVATTFEPTVPSYIDDDDFTPTPVVPAGPAQRPGFRDRMRDRWEQMSDRKKKIAAAIGGIAVVGIGLASAYLATKGMPMGGGNFAKNINDINEAKGSTATNFDYNFDTITNTTAETLPDSSGFDYPWNWAKEAVGGDNATTWLHELSQKAESNGHAVEWHGSGTQEWVSIDGKSNPKDVINVLRQYA
jgi:hypothetical protein